MTNEQKLEITKISKEFASGFKHTIGEISGSEFLIVDPLSGYLNFIGFENDLKEIPRGKGHPQVLIMTFNDGTQFVPAGSDLPHPEAKDWMWIDRILKPT